MGSLRSAIEDWGGSDLPALSDVDLMSDLAEIEQGIGLLEAMRAERLVVFESRRAFAADGAPSAQAWLVTECRMAPAAAAERLRVAQRLQDLPCTRAAFVAGEVGFEHVRAIESATRGVETDIDDELLLIDEARRHDAKGFASVASNWRHAVDAKDCLDDAERAYARRTFGIANGLDGMGVLGGRLDAEGTATVSTAVNALAAPRPGDDRSPGQDRKSVV